MKPRSKVLTILSLATLFSTALYAQDTNLARPGTVNYVEGHAALDGHALPARSMNTIAMDTGQTLSTSDGRVEVLLTPGVFLRVDHDSTIRMVSPTLTQTEIAVDRGRADLEVDALYPQNDLLLDTGTDQTKILKNGLYEFDRTANQLKVFEGKAAVSPNQDAKKWIDVKGGHELALTGTPAKSQSFDKDHSEDDLYRFSSLRATYLGQANASLLAENYAGAPGWAWDSAFDGYTWLPYGGYPYSPFGFGFYSPGFFYGGGFGGYYRRGFGGGYDGFRGGYGGGIHGGFGGGGGFHGGGGGGHR